MCEIQKYFTYKSQDIFGEKVSLNFDKNVSDYKTSLGSFITLIINSLLLALFVLKFIKMDSHRDDLISYAEQPISQEEAGFIDL